MNLKTFGIKFQTSPRTPGTPFETVHRLDRWVETKTEAIKSNLLQTGTQRFSMDFN